MRTATVLAAAVLAGGLTLAACGGSASPGPAAATTSAAAEALTSAQGAAICGDLNTWLAQAWNEDSPRFSAQMEADESQAGSTALGTDLQTLEPNLQSLNSDALEPSPPGYSPATGLAAPHADCATYGVNVQESAP